MSMFISAAILIIAFAVGYYRLSNYPYIQSIVTHSLNRSYDYVVVGGGSAGSVIASRLSEDPSITVLLLEAGGDYVNNQTYHTPLLWNSLQKTDVDWEYYTVPQKYSHKGMAGQRSVWPRGKVLGGTSMINAMQYTRGSRHDYDEWAKRGCDGWSYKEVLPYFLKSEDILIDKYKSSKYHHSGGYLGISTGEGFTQFTDLFLKGGQEMGYNVVDYNSETQEGWSTNQMTIRNGVRSSTSLEFLRQAKKRPNLHVTINAHVTKVAIDDKRATGVFYIKDNRKQFVEAKREVIVSAGSINSPQLLMLSGVGPKKHLRELNISVNADLPVGENLHDHMGLTLSSPTKDDIGVTGEKGSSWMTWLKYQLFGSGMKAFSGVETTAFFCSYPKKNANCQPDLQFFVLSIYLSDKNFNIRDDICKDYFGKPNTPGFTIIISLIDPKSVGTIKLKSADPFDYPEIDLQYLSDERELDTYLRGIRLWEKFLATPTLSKLGATADNMKLKMCSQYKFQSDDYWKCFIRYLGHSVYHPAGTCKMGKADDKTAVVDPQLKVRGIKSLRVVDASVMPLLPSGNPNAATIMIAEKAADMIRGVDSVKDIRDKLQNT